MRRVLRIAGWTLLAVLVAAAFLLAAFGLPSG
jgi:hypothetical protein